MLASHASLAGAVLHVCVCRHGEVHLITQSQGEPAPANTISTDNSADTLASSSPGLALSQVQLKAATFMHAHTHAHACTHACTR